MNIVKSIVKNMKISSLYHSTNQENLLSILRTKRLIANQGERIGGINFDYIYMSDLYHKYLSIIFGSVIIQFKTDTLFVKNNISPTVYDESNQEDFLSMPFEESEWSSKEVVFDYEDIEKIIFVISDTNDGEIAGVIDSIMEDEDISKDWVVQTKMPDYPYEFCLQRYRERIKNYAISKI